MVLDDDTIQRMRGALFGAAIGDAVGVTYEFSAPGTITKEPLEVLGGGPFRIPPGEGSDDTALLQIILGAYSSRNSFCPKAAVSAMAEWLASVPADVGCQTQRAIEAWRDGSQPALDEGAQGNGGLMRAAAHALVCDTLELARTNAAADTMLTHPSSFAAHCSAGYAGLLWSLLHRDGQNRAPFSCHWTPYPEPVASAGGHCVHSFRLALWALDNADGYEQGIEAVIRTGGDTDTNAAIAGGLLGARFGWKGLPKRWLQQLSPDLHAALCAQAKRLGF